MKLGVITGKSGFPVNNKKKLMKKLSECTQCQKRLGLIVFSLSLLGLLLGTKEIVKQIKNYKK